jgi:hypothetical protein
MGRPTSVFADAKLNEAVKRVRKAIQNDYIDAQRIGDDRMRGEALRQATAANNAIDLIVERLRESATKPDAVDPVEGIVAPGSTRVKA